MNTPRVGDTIQLNRFGPDGEKHPAQGVVVAVPAEWANTPWAVAPDTVWAIWGDDTEPTWCSVDDLVIITMKPRDIYAAVINGDPLTDKDLKEGIKHFSKMEELLRKSGPVFQLAANEAGRVARSLEDFQRARKTR